MSETTIITRKIEKRTKYVPAKIKCRLVNKSKQFMIDILPRPVKVWPIKDVRSEAMAITDTRIDYIGGTPKKFTTTCYLTPKAVPIWYTESVQIKINSTKRVYSDTVYYQTKLQPHYWSEHMQLDVLTQKLPPKTVGTSPMSPRGIPVGVN